MVTEEKHDPWPGSALSCGSHPGADPIYYPSYNTPCSAMLFVFHLVWPSSVLPTEAQHHQSAMSLSAWSSTWGCI